ncbi:MAG: glycosyltransferase, partial [Pseudomonadota bacterium]
MRPPKLLVVLKGYPRVSETFIAQELHGLQNAGIAFEIISLRRPYDPFRHPVHDQITAPVRYLPEYLHEEPLRVLASLLKVLGRRGLRKTLRLFLRDLRRDVTRNRVRRLGQAVVLAAEADPGEHWLHAHFAHTPTSVARYASTILGAPFTISAHAKDIWTSPEWELREKLTDARWSVTCTRTGCDYLRGIAPKSEVHLLYHGLDLERFPPPPPASSSRDGTSTTDPVRILSIGRAVPKKGYDTLLRALAALPEDLHWHFDHIGGGAERPRLETLAEELGLGARLTWHGPQDQARVLEAYRNADIFVLASQATAENDRDGLPNVLVEAASQGLACVATRFSAIPELIE